MKDEQLLNLINPIAADLGLQCLGIEFAPGSGNSLLRVYIDVADRPVTIEDCEAVSRELSAQLDVNDPIAGRYTLEVSSPGIDRPLFTPAHFERHMGERVKITLNLPQDGRRRLQGVIAAVEGQRISIEIDTETVHIEHDNIQKARLVPDYVALGLVAEKPKGAKPAAAKRKTDK